MNGSAIHQGETSSASRRRRDALIDGRTVRKWPRSGILVRAKKREPLGARLITSGSVRLPCGVRAADAAAGVDVYLRTRAMAAQDGSASAIYSTRKTGTLLPDGTGVKRLREPSGIILRLLPLRLRLGFARLSSPHDTLSQPVSY